MHERLEDFSQPAVLPQIQIHHSFACPQVNERDIKRILILVLLAHL